MMSHVLSPSVNWLFISVWSERYFNQKKKEKKKAETCSVFGIALESKIINTMAKPEILAPLNTVSF